MDFFSPQAIDETLNMVDRLSRCPRDTSVPPDQSLYQDKLQVGGRLTWDVVT